jgi:AraC-like DNA-binding protein
MGLLEVKFPDKRVVFRTVTLSVTLIIAVFAVYAACADHLFMAALFILATLYALLLLHYTRLFLVAYRRVHEKMDNYFSDFETKRIRWVALSFFAALAIGVMALLFAVYTSALTAIMFTLVFDVFYVWFAIRLNNYAHRFSVIENALDVEPQETHPEDDKKTEYAEIDTKINEWVTAKKFAKNDFSLETLALELGTNRNYLSTYFKNVKGIGFSKWINELRIEEAKKLMLQNPGMTLKNIAEQTGFADNSHLIRNFTKLTGVSPTEWKKSSD